jgi:hypothetical protein
MRFLLLNVRLEATWFLNRVAVDLTAQQDEDAGRDGEDRQDYAEATNTQKLYYAPGDEKDCQQYHANIFGKFHTVILSNLNEWRASGPAALSAVKMLRITGSQAVSTGKFPASRAADKRSICLRSRDWMLL